MSALDLKRICAAILISLTCLLSTSAQNQSSQTPLDEANALFQAQKWTEAAQAYRAIAKLEPTNARVWFQLGWSLHGLGQYERAIDAFQKALEINKGNQRASFSMYAIGVMYAEMKDKDRAIEWLNKALDAKFPQPRQIKNNRSLAALSDDPRFQQVLAKAEKAAQVCMNTPEYRGFDFWLGDWNVFNPQGQQVGTNKVVLLADGCIVEENWENTGGGIGKSFNFYNPTTRKWHQSYMDNNGSNWMMDGELKDGVLRYEGAIYSPTGKVLVHMTFYNLGADKVRQTAETSSDDGKTWTSVWDGMYVRKK